MVRITAARCILESPETAALKNARLRVLTGLAAPGMSPVASTAETVTEVTRNFVQITLRHLTFKMHNVLGTWSVAQIIVGQFGGRIHQVCGIAAFNRIGRRLHDAGINKI